MNREQAKQQADALRRAAGVSPASGAARTAAELRRVARGAAARAALEAERLSLAAASRREADALRRAVGLPTADEQFEIDQAAVKQGTMDPDAFLVKHGDKYGSEEGTYWLTTTMRMPGGGTVPVKRVYYTRAAIAERERQQERAVAMLSALFNGGGLRVNGVAGGRRVSNVQAQTTGGGYGGR